ncbi:MAG: toxin-antitoxin system HicB family antitoxin [Nostoc sp.]
MPKSLHRRLAETSEREGVGLNQYIVSLLSAISR